ncbi:hypothetical protein CHN51_13385 [Sphingorhabdus sp. YGSMI21]|nr:hypothetical protein CHN51_13385 [Sphingorhabdus sp. YGSMI21]
MGYIFASGTGFAAPTSGLRTSGAALVLLLGASATASEAPAAVAPAISASIDLEISGLRSEKGNVLVCLSANPKYFPDCSKDKQARKLKVSAGKAEAIQIADVKPGTYAVALVHDENANGKMDLRLFLPREGFGFSRNPKIGMGPPKFKSAQFTIGTDDARYAVRMKYIL